MVLLRFCNVDTVNLMFGDRLTGNHNVHHHYHCPEHRFPGPNDHSDGGSGGGADGGDQPPPSNGPSPPLVLARPMVILENQGEAREAEAMEVMILCL